MTFLLLLFWFLAGFLVQLEGIGSFAGAADAVVFDPGVKTEAAGDRDLREGVTGLAGGGVTELLIRKTYKHAVSC